MWHIPSMKKIALATISFGILFLAHLSFAQSSPNFWLLQNNGQSGLQLKPISNSWGIKSPATTTLSSLAGATGCLSVDGTGNITTSTCSGGGGGGGSGNGNVFVSPTSSVVANQIPYWVTSASSTLSPTSSLTFVPGASTSTLQIGTSSKPMCFMGIDTVNSSTYDSIKFVNGVMYETPSSTCQ